jgi:hypothetical protein
VLFRLPQWALVFLVLIFALGALVLASSNIEPGASVRAAFTQPPTLTPTPVDPFVNLEYVTFRTVDGLFSLEHPASWAPQPNPANGPVAYAITPPEAGNVGIGLLALPKAQLGIPDVPTDAAPDVLLRALFADQPDIQVRPVEAAGLSGAGARQTQSQPDPVTGQVSTLERDIWMLDLDPQNVLIIQGIAPGNFWPQMEAVFARAVQSLQVDENSMIAQISSFFATPTPEVTAEATTAPTSEATAEATAQATAAPTSQATVAPTAEATAVPTSEATAAPTAEPTAAPTVAATPTPASF